MDVNARGRMKFRAAERHLIYRLSMVCTAMGGRWDLRPGRVLYRVRHGLGAERKLAGGTGHSPGPRGGTRRLASLARLHDGQGVRGQRLQFLVEQGGRGGDVVVAELAEEGRGPVV